jgi:RNA polymerase sigma-70 factor (ECF subfamily)
VQSFENVLFAARAGAEWAWERIYEELSPSLAGYFRGQGCADPEDLVAEVFLQVVRGLDGFSGTEPAFRAWVFTIAHRRMVDDVRRRVRRPVVPTEPAVVDAAAGEGGDVTEDAFAGLDRERVQAAIAELPGEQRSVLLLRIIGDLTIEQIAEAMGKRPGAVKALQRRALRKLETAYPFPALQR